MSAASPSPSVHPLQPRPRRPRSRGAAWIGAVALTALVAGGLAAPVHAAPAAATGFELPDTAQEQAAPGHRSDEPSAQQHAQRRAAPQPTAAASAYAEGLLSQRVTLRSTSVQNAPGPEQRLSRVEITRDLVKRKISAKAVFAKTPTTSTDSVVLVALGTWSGSSCSAEVLLAGAAVASAAQGQFSDPQANLTVQRSRSGNVLTLTSAVHSRIRSGDWDCAFARNVAASNAVYTGFYADELQDRYTPKLRLEPGDPLQGSRKGRTTKVEVTVRNVGKSDATNVRLRASGSGLSVSRASRSFSKIGDRSSRSATFNVKVKRGTLRTLTVTVKASGGSTVTKRIRIAVIPKPKKLRSLSGRYFWGWLPTAYGDSEGWKTRAVWFLNSKWAYLDFPKNGKKPHCSRTTENCKRYTYAKRSGKAKIGKRTFRVTTEGFTYQLAGDAKAAYFDPLTLPKKGAKFAASLVNRDWSGNCIISCTSTTEWLTLGRNGRFVRSSSYVGSWPGIGTSWSGVSPNQRGTYRVISTGRIELRYASGKTQRHSIGIMQDIRGKTSPGTGIVLGSTNFYRD